MDIDAEAVRPAINRLKRARGQLDAVIRMTEEGRSCTDVVTQLAAVGSAIDKAGFAIIADSLRRCMADPEHELDSAELEKLFLSLA